MGFLSDINEFFRIKKHARRMRRRRAHTSSTPICWSIHSPAGAGRLEGIVSRTLLKQMIMQLDKKGEQNTGEGARGYKHTHTFTYVKVKPRRALKKTSQVKDTEPLINKRDAH